LTAGHLPLNRRWSNGRSGRIPEELSRTEESLSKVESVMCPSFKDTDSSVGRMSARRRVKMGIEGYTVVRNVVTGEFTLS
jgi:hypothetical protein